MLTKGLLAVVVALGMMSHAQAANEQPRAAGDSKQSAATAQAGTIDVQPVNHRQVDRWRYRWHNNHWWYWTPGNSWVIYYNNGWLPYSVGTYNQYYPSYGYYGGYNPGYSYYGPTFGFGYGYSPYRNYGYYGGRGYYRGGRGWYGDRYGWDRDRRGWGGRMGWGDGRGRRRF